VLLSQPTEPRARLTWEIDALADRYRGLSQARLLGALPRPVALTRAAASRGGQVPADGSHVSRAGAGHRLAQLLADAAAGVAGRAADIAPASRPVPIIDVFALGEQIAVTGHDLGLELEGLADRELVWDGDRRVRVATLVARVTGVLKELRLAL
jgi:hypothetical protein